MGCLSEKIKQEVVEWDYKCLLGVFRAIALTMLTQLANRLTIAAVLRQKQAGRITGGLFFWVCLKMGVGGDPTIDPQNGHSMVTIRKKIKYRGTIFSDKPICFWMLTDMR